MQRLICLSLVTVLSASLMAANFAEEEEPTTENTTIKSIMSGAHKSEPKGTGLLKKVATGKSTAEETKHLLKLYKVMLQLPPPQGEADSWKERTGLLVNAVDSILKGEEDGVQKLTKASDCKACHLVHKPSS